MLHLLYPNFLSSIPRQAYSYYNPGLDALKFKIDILKTIVPIHRPMNVNCYFLAHMAIRLPNLRSLYHICAISPLQGKFSSDMGASSGAIALPIWHRGSNLEHIHGKPHSEPSLLLNTSKFLRTNATQSKQNFGYLLNSEN